MSLEDIYNGREMPVRRFQLLTSLVRSLTTKWEYALIAEVVVLMLQKMSMFARDAEAKES